MAAICLGFNVLTDLPVFSYWFFTDIQYAMGVISLNYPWVQATHKLILFEQSRIFE